MLCGPGGAGKGTVAARLVAAVPKLWLSRSWTTRARRSGEPADAYIFVDRAAFDGHAQSGGFLEWAEFLGNLYGTPWPVDAGEGMDVLLEIDVQGAEQVRSRDSQALVILLLPPTAGEQEARLRSRGDSEEHVMKRLQAAEIEASRARLIADYEVVNDTVERAATEIAGIIESRRNERGYVPDVPVKES